MSAAALVPPARIAQGPFRVPTYADAGRARPLRVAMVTDTYAPAANGVVRSVQTSREALATLGVDAHVFAPAARSFAKRVRAEGVSFFPAVETSIYPNLHVSILPLLPRHLRGFDLVHVHTPGPLGIAALFAAHAADIPAVYTYHTRFDDLLHYLAPFESAERLLAKGAAGLNRSLIRGTSAVIAPTPAIADELAAGFGVQPEVVSTGVDLSFFRETPGLREDRDDGPVVLHLGRISREKNLETVLRAFPLVLEEAPHAKLLVAGAGPDAERSRRLAASLGLGDAVEFLGFVPEADLPSVYGRADVYVSASEFETQGITVLEAMACGAAVAIADVPVFRPVGDAGAAVLFNAKDPSDVARGILQAHADRRELRERGRGYARENSTEASARRLLALYERLA